MSDGHLDDPNDPSVTVLERMVSVCDRFEAEWRAGRRPVIEDFLAAAAAADRLPLFERLLGLELELRRAAGEALSRNEYQSRFPNFSAIVDTVFASELSPSETRAYDASAASRGKTFGTTGLSPFQPGRTVAGYEIVRMLGHGGMGSVFGARQLKAGNRLVALKCIRAEFLEGMPADLRAEAVDRFQAEARAVANLRHANLLTVYDVGDMDGWPFFSMQFVDGGSLADRLRTGPLLDDEAAAIIEKVALAVHHAHQEHVLHRDLKPANILLDKSGEPYVADFGLAKQLEPLKAQATATRAEAGTPPYMPPERARGEPVDARTDVYGLGATLYHALTGRPPFQAATAVETLRQVVDNDPLPPTELNPALDPHLATICLKGLRKEPGKRYATALGLAA